MRLFYVTAGNVTALGAVMRSPFSSKKRKRKRRLQTTSEGVSEMRGKKVSSSDRDEERAAFRTTALSY